MRINNCPFCGSDDVTLVSDGFAEFVVCGECSANGPVDGDYHAIERWNQVERDRVGATITVTVDTNDEVSKLLGIAAKAMEQWERGRGLSYHFPIAYANVSEATITRPDRNTVRIEFREQR